jgi:hypothetical protein
MVKKMTGMEKFPSKKSMMDNEKKGKQASEKNMFMKKITKKK